MRKIVEQGIAFFRRDTVLCIAVILAVVSAFLVPPSGEYLNYIDWNTLALLFGLMAVMKGFQQAGVFLFLGNRLLGRMKSSRQMLAALVFLPFFFSMVITNDVSLITFVPFGLIVLQMAGQEELAVVLVVLQTVAANMGSVLTPMGNPQNLYLYARSGMRFTELCGLMLPYVLVSGAFLLVLILRQRSVPVAGVSVQAALGSARSLLCCTAGFVLCMLGVFKVLPPVAIACVVALFLLATDRKLLAQVDYSLLGTFIAFFIFIGNLGNIGPFKVFLESILEGHEMLVAVLASQVTSNVPAALLLSEFTTRWDALIVGCNVGGLGTLIASMASLISYKQIGEAYPERRKVYFARFTICNVCLLAILLALYFLLPA